MDEEPNQADEYLVGFVDAKYREHLFALIQSVEQMLASQTWA
jgi:hypothetical protein